jgi:mutual gliding-motility protein MglA
VQINLALREVSCKIVYYGPGRSGKTTNLEMVHAKAPKDSVGELVSISTETDRTLFFDFLPLNLGSVAGMTTKFALYTVPGQVYYNRTRKLVLQGADGVVFVADSSAKMLEENIESLDNLVENLEENGLDISTLPLVLQWNKRDVPDAMSPEELEKALNRWKCPTCEAVAVKGEGVFPALKLVAAQVIKRLNSEYGQGGGGGRSPGARSAPVASKPAVVVPAAAPKPAAAKAPVRPAPKVVPAPVDAPAGVASVRPAAPKAAPAAPPPARPAAARAAPAAAAPARPAAPKAVPAARPAAAAIVPSVAPQRPAAPAPAPKRPSIGYDDADDEQNPIKRELERRRRQAESGSEKKRERAAGGAAAIKTIRSVQKGGGKGKVVMLALGVVLLVAVALLAALHFTKMWPLF